MKPRRNRLLTDTLREVRKTMSRFLSLALLSALAVYFLAGLRTTAPDMELSADTYYDRQNLMDIRVLSTLGLTDDDIAALAAQKGVSAAEGSYTVDAQVHLEENDVIIKLLSLSDRGINTPALLSGRFPENDRECVVESALLKRAGLSLGDSISFDTGSGTFEGALKYESYTVVGTANSPLYVSVDRGSSTLGTGRVSAFALLPSGAFQMDYYTDAYLLADGMSGLLCYGDEYKDRMKGLIDSFDSLAVDRAALRHDEVLSEANQKLADAQKEFDDAEAEANRKLADAKKELSDGWADYYEGQATLARETADAKRQIADAEKKLPDAKKELERGEADYLSGQADLAEGKQKYWDGLKTWQDGHKEYEDGLAELEKGEAEYAESQLKLSDAQAEYDDGYRRYQEGLAALKDGGGQLMAAQRQLADAEEQLASGSAALSAGQSQLAAQKQNYAQLLAALDGTNAALGALGLTPPTDPADQAGQAAFAAALAGVAAASPAALQDGVITPLRTLLSAFRAQLDVSSPEGSAQAAQLDGLLAALPADAAALGGLLAAGQPGVSTLTTGLLGALAASRAALQTMDAALQAGQRQLDSGSAALSAGYSQYAQGKKAYDEAKAKFDQGVEESQKAGQTLFEAKAKLENGWAELRAGREKLDSGWSDLYDARQELQDGWAELEKAKQEILDGEVKLADARAELDSGWAEYRSGVRDLADAKRKLPEETAKAERELADALKKLTDGEAEYADGKREAEEKLSDARRELNDARRKIADIDSCKWYVLGRDANMGYVSFQQDADRMGNLASVFPLIFFLVAALVCLTTMTRMVEEQRVEIGGKKALGYSKWAISLKYVGYGFSASLLGGLVGLAAGCITIPWIIFTAWKILYNLGDLVIPVYPGISLLSLAAAVLCVTLTAFAASFAALTAAPAELMRPRAPKPGKRVVLERIKPLWNRMSFTWKVTVRNLFRYKKRFWMTVIGIGGCTALIVTGFGLRNSIYDTLDKQFDEISTYSSQIGLADGITDDEMAEISRALDQSGHVSAWMPCHNVSLTVDGPGRSMDAYLFAVEDEEHFAQFIHLRHRLDRQGVTLPEDGVVLTEKLAYMLGVGVGDTVTLEGDTRVEVPVRDITENYIYHYIYLSANYYAQLFGAQPKTNLVMVQYDDESKAVSDQISSDLISLSGVTSVGRIRDNRDTFSKGMQSVDYAVILIIVCAAALAFVVLFNLTNINITERLRELATLKVLGFYNKELASYVYRENVFLTVFGVLMGLVMGKFLHQWLVLTVEIDMVMFGRTVRPISYLYAVGLTILFSLLVNLAARKKLQRIDMVESLKTVD